MVLNVSRILMNLLPENIFVNLKNLLIYNIYETPWHYYYSTYQQFSLSKLILKYIVFQIILLVYVYNNHNSTKRA